MDTDQARPENQTDSLMAAGPAAEKKGSGSRIQAARGPAARYASLNRVKEHGAMDEKSWSELAMVCIALDKREEALTAYQNLSSYGPRRHVHTALVEKGWLRKNELTPDVRDVCVTDKDMRPSFSEGAADAFGFLVSGRMPVYAMAGTIAFGALMLLGGAISSLVGTLVAGAVIVPLALALYGATWVAGRLVLESSCQGFDDPPEMPNRGAWMKGAKAAVMDVAVASVVLFAPAVLIHWLVPVAVVQFPVLWVSWTLFPLVMALRSLTPGWRGLGPRTVLSVVKADPGVRLAVLSNAALFAPAAWAMHATVEQSVFLVLCSLGLLTVMPILVSMRMLGQTLHYAGDSVPGITVPRLQTQTASAGAKKRPTAPRRSSPPPSAVQPPSAPPPPPQGS